MANIFERVLAAVAPGTAAVRAANRRKFEIIEKTRLYDGASNGRRLINWTGRLTSANAEIKEGGVTLRQRARDLARNNGYADKIITNHADNIVGAGITPRARTGNPTLDATINDAFDAWQRAAGVEGEPFYELQYRSVREMAEAGESLFRRAVIRPPSNLSPEQKKLWNPLRLLLLESEQIDGTKDGAVGSRFASNGIEYNNDGTRRAIWLFGQHPGDSAKNPKLKRESAAVPVTELSHMFRRDRSQSRGMPWLAPVMVPLRELDEYTSYELVRKKIEACTVGVIEHADDDDIGGLGLTDGADEDEDGNVAFDSSGNPTEMMEPGMFHHLAKGRTIKFNSPQVSPGIEGFIRVHLRKIASGASIPYAYLASDTSQGNHSSDRGIVIQHRRNIDHHQWHVVIPALEVVMGWFAEGLVMNGTIQPDTVIKWEWSPPRYESISPIDDAKADILEVRAGFKSEKEAIGSRGGSIEQVYAEKKEAMDLADSYGLVLDTDVRAVSLNGQSQLAGGQDGEDPTDPTATKSTTPPTGKKPVKAPSPTPKK